jgi:hypothetical protein
MKTIIYISAIAFVFFSCTSRNNQQRSGDVGDAPKVISDDSLLNLVQLKKTNAIADI